MKKYITVPVKEISLTTTRPQPYEKETGEYSFDIQIDDGGDQVEKMYSEEQKAYLLSILTKRQQQVAVLLFEGYNRPDIAKNLVPGVCVQAVHQIILRIRKRLFKRAGVNLLDRQTYHANI